jgi:hypothetical protein
MAHLRNILIIGGAALAIAAIPAPASACSTGCSTSTGGSTGSTGGTPVPAPAALALFGLAAGGLIARRRRA